MTTMQIALTQGKVALVDAADFASVSQFKWCAVWNGQKWYAMRKGSSPRCETIYLHRFIMDAPKGTLVDHKNTDGLDCRRKNLRLCTNPQNNRNTNKRCNNSSGFKGVTWDKQVGRWKAQITINRRNISLGHFEAAEMAAKAYDDAARLYHGEFARHNNA